MKEAILPDGLTELGFPAFKNCASIKTLDIPQSITTLGVQRLNAQN
ncbi:MAG: hypothetical protein KIG36_03640 [Eubacteriales bacterium]|nr:hypothetical protein [Eubacteriales bacterium]